MGRQRFLLILIGASGSLLFSVPRSAHAQGIFTPWYKLAEVLDEKRLQHDQARLQADIAKGDTARVTRDVAQIRRDEWWLDFDRTGFTFRKPAPLPPSIGMDMVLVPHPQYPGYGYYPSNPAQLYALSQSAPGATPAPGGGASSAAAPGSTPAMTTTPPVSVVIRNPEQAGTAVNYVVDGITYKTESGGFQRLAVAPAATIDYDRGGSFGVRRYDLSAGVYEFRASDTGWALVKLRPAP